MPGYYESIGCPCPAVLRSETVCSFVNDQITIDFNIGKWDNESLQRDYPEFNLDNQQLYIFRPSDIFKKSFDSFVTEHSRGRDNLECSYEMLDEFNGLDGLANGHFNTSDSFACKYDAKKMQDGLLSFDDDVPFYLHSSRMPLKNTSDGYSDEATFRKVFQVGDYPGTYCVNVTTYRMFDRPSIKFWDRTPLCEQFPQLNLPDYDNVYWISIASGFLVFFAVCDALYDFNMLVSTLVAVCLCKNFLEALSVLFQASDLLFLQVLITAPFGIFLTLISIAPFIVSCERKETPAEVLCPSLLMNIYFNVVMCVDRFTRQYGYFAIGTIMNDLVFYRYNGQIRFLITLFVHFVAWAIYSKEFFRKSVHFRQKATRYILLMALYYFTCFLIKLSFLTRKSKFLDTFYKNFTVVFYSRLNEILLMVFICGKFSWKMFARNYYTIFNKLKFKD